MTGSAEAPRSASLRSWTHDTGAVSVAGEGRRTRFYSQYEPRFETLDGGFGDAVLTRRYSSDGHGGHHFIPLLEGFDELLGHHPAIFDRDRALVVEAQAQADERRQEMARQGQYEDQLLTLHTGLGQRLGEIYLEAMLDGDLPKTYQLLSKYRPYGRVAGEGASCNPAKAHWAERSVRPYLTIADQLKVYDFAEGDAHAGRDGSFPSGHTSEAYWQGLTLATFLPELAAGILARTADSGHSRAVMGAHYPLDIIGGRMMGSYIAAGRWHDAGFRPLLDAARTELRGLLEERYGASLAEAAAEDVPYMPEKEARSWFRELLTYGFPRVGEGGRPLEVPVQASALLRTSHPDLDDAQRAEVLRLSALDSGYPLDKAGPYGGWQRLDLLAAMTSQVTVGPHGEVGLA